MCKPRVAILDSGILASNAIAPNIVDSYVLNRDGCGWNVTSSPLEDHMGHGTAIANIMCSINRDLEIICIQIYDESIDVDETGLVYALKYIYNNLDVDFINISAGITYLNDDAELDHICSSLAEKGVVIVSAFDNDGAISFPAALDCVIGVDTEKDYENRDDITFVKNGIVNLLVADRYYRTTWLQTKTILKGTSFACAYITALLSLHLEEFCTAKNKSDILQKIATKSIEYFEFVPPNKPSFHISKAIVFPVNKETHAVLRFKDQLSFEIVGVYDERLSGKVGKIMWSETILSFDNIDWNGDFDTIILSGTEDLSRLTKRDYKSVILDKAIKNKKNIYSFESIDSSYENLYYPSLNQAQTPYKNNFKLHKTTIPVVGVFGTSSKQGKFTLQREIIHGLSKLGYQVGAISTEPSGYLFDSDFVFHFGYHADIQLQPWQCSAILNEMIWDTQLTGKDILVTGCQSGILHYSSDNINNFSIYQYAFLLGTLPDFQILCINPHDDLEYVQRSIEFLNSVDEGEVCAIAIFPMRAVVTLSGIGYKMEQINVQDMQMLKKELASYFNVPIYEIGNKSDLSLLCEQIVNYFSEDAKEDQQ